MRSMLSCVGYFPIGPEEYASGASLRMGLEREKLKSLEDLDPVLLHNIGISRPDLQACGPRKLNNIILVGKGVKANQIRGRFILRKLALAFGKLFRQKASGIEPHGMCIRQGGAVVARRTSLADKRPTVRSLVGGLFKVDSLDEPAFQDVLCAWREPPWWNGKVSRGVGELHFSRLEDVMAYELPACLPPWQSQVGKLEMRLSAAMLVISVLLALRSGVGLVGIALAVSFAAVLFAIGEVSAARARKTVERRQALETAKGARAVLSLAEALQEQEAREAVSAFAALSEAGRALDASAAKRACEAWLSERGGVRCHMDAASAIAKLVRAGLVKEEGKRVVACSSQDAVATLDAKWKGFFSDGLGGQIRSTKSGSVSEYHSISEIGNEPLASSMEVRRLKSQQQALIKRARQLQELVQSLQAS